MKRKLKVVSILLCLVMILPMILSGCSFIDGIIDKVFPKTQYTVMFLDDDGQTLIEKAQKIDEGEEFVLPEAPEKEGYEFIGWLLDGKLYDFEAKDAMNVTGNMSFTASYSIKTFTVAFYDSDGVTLIGTSQSVKYGKYFALEDAPKKTGYTFVGWVKDGDTDAYDMYASGARVVKSDIKFVAKYQKDSFVQENGGDSYADDLPQW